MTKNRFFLALGAVVVVAACDGRQGSEDVSYRDMPEAPATVDNPAGSTEAAAVEEASAQPQFDGVEMPAQEVIGDGALADWIIRPDVVGVRSAEYEGSVLLRFRNAEQMTDVVTEIAPREGETYRASLDLRAVDGGDAEVRLMLSRDCAADGDDLSLSVHNVSASVETVFVEHTFSADYECMKFIVQVLNASSAAPKALEFSDPTYTLID